MVACSARDVGFVHPGRECDPDLCGLCTGTCDGSAAGEKTCGNMRLRLGQHKCAASCSKPAVTQHASALPMPSTWPHLLALVNWIRSSCNVMMGQAEYEHSTSRALWLCSRRRLAMGLSTVAGWGAFLHAPARKDQLLGEYTGELITQAEADRRCPQNATLCCMTSGRSFRTSPQH
jgi:hypothetical protein